MAFKYAGWSLGNEINPKLENWKLSNLEKVSFEKG